MDTAEFVVSRCRFGCHRLVSLKAIMLDPAKKTRQPVDNQLEVTSFVIFSGYDCSFSALQIELH
jgi:hypothetical protein